MRRLSALLLGLTLALPALSLVGASHSASAAVPKVRKIAMVDLQRVLNDTKAGKAARTKLEASSKKKQAKFDKKRRALEADFAKAQKLTGQAQVEAAQKLQQDEMDLQQMAMAMQQGLVEEEGKLLETIYTNSQAIVATMSGEQGIDLVLVLDPMTVLYNKDGLDITDEVVKRYDKKHPK